MIEDTHDIRFPRRLLLATDLCAGCDRPLDRARQLAAEWRADVTVLMVREGPATPEEVASWLDAGQTRGQARGQTVHAFELAARSEVAEEFAGTGVSASLAVAHGDVTDGILDTAARMPDALVVIGASREETFQHLLLGSTAGRLAQALAQPVLMVRRRVRASYERIVVATDFSAPSMRALETAARLFPGRRITLLHVMDDSADPASELYAVHLQWAYTQCKQFLAQCDLPAHARPHVDIVVRHGAVTETITSFVTQQGVELAVLGVPRHSVMTRVFIGSRSEDLLRSLPCDILLVRAAQEGGDD